MSESAGDGKLEMKQASKEVKESENVAEKYSAMTVSRNSDVNMGDLSSAFSAVTTHKSVKKVGSDSETRLSFVGKTMRATTPLTSDR